MKSAVMAAIVAAILGSSVFAAPAVAGEIDEGLAEILASASPAERIPVYITLVDRLDARALDASLTRAGRTRAQRHFEVVTSLQEHAAATQGPLVSALASAASAGEASPPRAFWIANAVALAATPAVIDAIAARKDVLTVYHDQPIELIEPIEGAGGLTADAAAGIAPGIVNSRAPELWALGIDGTGTLACDQDTGADGAHPAFADRWRGLDGGVTPAEAWFDPVGSETFPTDSGSHGTHTLGTILGDDGAGSQVGMAPGAKWIGAKTIDVPGGNIYSDAVAAFQWMADPDGNPATTDDVPDVVNNSWGIPNPQCKNDFYDSMDAAEAAGVVIVFAAGNEGPIKRSLRSPGNRITTDLNSFAVGALEQGGQKIANFSSRGPSRCDDVTIKPEVSAVGVDVLSSFPNNTYGTLSGTSMATPHVAGAVLLLRQAYPEATVDEVKMALYETAIDLGDAGEDNVFGRGRIDVVEAYLWLLAQTMDSDADLLIDTDLVACNGEIGVTLADADLTTFAAIDAFSDTETITETLSLAPSGIPGYFSDSVQLAPGAPVQDGKVQVADGDTVTIRYIDADDGLGGTDVAKTRTAIVDCVPPAFVGVESATAGENEVALTWTNSVEPGVTYSVYRSDTSGVFDFNAPYREADASPWTDRDAPADETWYYVVRAADALGNEDTNTVEADATPFGDPRIFWNDFDWYPIGDWTIVDGGGGEVTWTDEVVGSHSFPPDVGKVAIVDRGTTSGLELLNESLVTPPLDCGGFVNVTLRFLHIFERGFAEDAILQWSYDGVTWTPIEKYRLTETIEKEYALPEADRHTQFFVRFHYEALFGGEFWAVDDVEVTGERTTLPPVTTTTTTTTAPSTTTTTIPGDDDTADDDTGDDDADDDDTATDDDTADDDASDDDAIDDDDATDDDDAIDDDDTAGIPLDDDAGDAADGEGDDEEGCCGC
ncbi:S8 family serine peptidase [bacterium]|nr:S8 family serine peptidase [bacterium]